jgi:5-methylthioadenosine/S-adenosylhomocysteine deaminase
VLFRSTVSEESLRWIAELSRERRLPVQIHLAETEEEVGECVATHGVRPAADLDRLGFFGELTVLAHGVWLDQAEIELIAERGCTVVTNPVANMKLAVGEVFDYPAAREAGVPVGLGTDGAGSNDSLDLLADLKAFALVQRHAAGDATVLGSEEAWRIATGASAPLLTATTSELHQIRPPADGEFDAVRVGGVADFLLLRPRSYELGLGDLHSDLVYAASGSVVETTVVAGRVLMQGGEIEGSEEVVAQAAERAARLGLS